MYVDNEENIYMIERIDLVEHSTPEELNSDDIDQRRIAFDDHYIIQRYHVLRKLDKTGVDLIEPVDTTDLLDNIGAVYEIISDIQDNIYIREWNAPGSRVFVFKSDGNFTDILDLRGFINIFFGFITLPNGNVASAMSNGDDTVLMEIDAETGTWGQEIILPGNKFLSPLQQGNDEYPIFYYRGTTLTGYNPDTGAFIDIIDPTEAGIMYSFLFNVSILDDGRIMLITDTWNENTEIYEAEILYVTKTPFDPSERTLLTLAAYRPHPDFIDIVTAFNRSSNTHFIQIIDYTIHAGDGDDGWMMAIDRLSLDITTGKIPDILLGTYEMPISRYAEIGLLEDLYPFIDSDPELSRGSFVEGVLESTENDGGLYRVFPYFFITSIVGNPTVLGENPGWDMDEFLAVLAANPQADIPLGKWETRDTFFRFVFNNNLDWLVDKETGTADFDNERFTRLLESMNFLPPDASISDDFPENNELISRGRQIMSLISLSRTDSYQIYRKMFGGDIVFKGFPTDSGSGNLLTIYEGISMTVTCSDKDGAWEFVRTIVTEDWQRRNFNSNPPEYSFFSVNKVVFDEMIKEAMNEPEGSRKIGGWHGFEMDSVPLTQEEADQILGLISGESWNTDVDMGLWNIVREEAVRYFNGQTTAHDAARVIQNRASIFMSEQYGW
jgi:hypothetical protein